tara:strand:+ start:641 stop:1114 length:474 start_codon:yes stop_codon:yes gene_type:complete
MYKFYINNLILLVFITCSLILSSAYFIEFALGYEACNLCLIGRIPYYFAIFFSLFFLIFKKYKKFILRVLFICFVVSAMIAFYHFGIEQDFFSESLVCKIKSLDSNVSATELLRELENKQKSCKNVDFRIFGQSLATINLFISLILSFIIFKHKDIK